MSKPKSSPSTFASNQGSKSKVRPWFQALRAGRLFSPTGVTVAVMTGVAVTTALPTLGISLATAGIGAAALKMWAVSLTQI